MKTYYRDTWKLGWNHEVIDTKHLEARQMTEPASGTKWKLNDW